MTFEEIGRGLGWVGGILYLIQFVEHQVKSSSWYQKRLLERIAKRHPAVPMPEMRMHKVTCELCGENVGGGSYCKHPDAPEYKLPALPTILSD